MKLLRWLAEFTIVAILMFVMAYLYIEAWDATEYVDQARRAEKYQRESHSLLAPTGLHIRIQTKSTTHNYGDASEPQRSDK